MPHGVQSNYLLIGNNNLAFVGCCWDVRMCCVSFGSPVVCSILQSVEVYVSHLFFAQCDVNFILPNGLSNFPHLFHVVLCIIINFILSYELCPIPLVCLLWYSALLSTSSCHMLRHNALTFSL